MNSTVAECDQIEAASKGHANMRNTDYGGYLECRPTLADRASLPEKLKWVLIKLGF